MIPAAILVERALQGQADGKAGCAEHGENGSRLHAERAQGGQADKDEDGVSDQRSKNRLERRIEAPAAFGHVSRRATGPARERRAEHQQRRGRGDARQECGYGGPDRQREGVEIGGRESGHGAAFRSLANHELTEKFPRAGRVAWRLPLRGSSSAVDDLTRL